MGYRFLSLTGLLTMLLVAWLLSEDRRRVDWRLVGLGVGLQAVLGVLLLKTPLEGAVFGFMRRLVDVLNAAAGEGAAFVFGTLTEGAVIRQEALVGAPRDLVLDAPFAFQVLPVIIFVSACSAILYHLRVIPAIVHGIAWCMRRTLRTSGAETFVSALLIFLGVESVLGVREYVRRMTRSELCTVMTTFMATIAGSVMVVYATFGAEPGHLLTASLMSAPAAIVVSKLLVPETETPETRGSATVRAERSTCNVLDAASRGAQDGVYVALYVTAMVIVFIGLIHLLNMGFGAATGERLSFVGFMGYVFRPLAFLLGVPWDDAATVSELLGMKTVLNEFVAYLSLSSLVATGELSRRAVTISTYALCGFANPGSLGIAVAVLDSIAPERRQDVARLGWRSFVGGTLASFMTACVAGVLIYE